MTNRQFHILTILLLLVGPIITLISELMDSFYFTFYIFPLTIDSLVFSVNPQDFKELSIVRMILPLFFMKVLVIGIISLIRLYKGRAGDKLLTRFYILVLLICLFKLVGLFVDAAYSNGLNFTLGLIALLSWTTLLGVTIKKQRTTQAISHGGTVDI